MTELYTASRIKTLHTCPRLHYYKYSLGVQLAPGEAARFGTLGHAALEAWYRTWMDGDLDGRLDAALAVVDATDLAPIERVRLRILIVAYHERWQAMRWTVVAVEQEFRYELDGRTVGGKIDAIIHDDETGEIWIVEHKTTRQGAEPGSPYWQRLAIDSQLSIYVDGATMLGYDVAGCIYDVLRVPQHELKLATPIEKREYTQGKGCKLCRGKAGVRGSGRVGDATCNQCNGAGWTEEPKLYAKQRAADETLDEFSDRVLGEVADNPDHFLVRGKVVRLADELPRMRLDLIDAIQMAEHCAAQDAWPRNSGACSQYGTLCPFFGACSGAESIDDIIRFPRSGAHPELASAA